MSDTPPPTPQGRRLRIWQQNLNKSLMSQLFLLDEMKPEIYDLGLIQEPHIDFRGVSRSNTRFATIYPARYLRARTGTPRSLIMVNTRLPSASWTAIPIDSLDVTAVQLRGDYGTIRIINVYNDCEHNDAL
ncbi:hypothetical protein C8R43DRAFT_883075, partial [Mycena crocata]